MIGVVPAVFLVDKAQLNGEPVPRTWEEILGPRFENRIALPVGDFDLFNGILLTIWKDFGDEGVRGHRPQPAGGHAPQPGRGPVRAQGRQGPMVSVIPYFFSKMAQFNPDAEIVWPERRRGGQPHLHAAEGLGAPGGSRPDRRLLRQPEVGEILAHRGLFPSAAIPRW